MRIQRRLETLARERRLQLVGPCFDGFEGDNYGTPKV
jgi:hypothetical protein